MQDLTEGLEYLIPEDAAELVPFAVNNGSSQVPSGYEGKNIDGFGFLKKMSEYWSIALTSFAEGEGDGPMHTFIGKVDNQGGGTEWAEIPIFDINCPLPGYITLANDIDLSISAGSMGIISFGYLVTENTFMFIDAEIRSSVSPNAEIRSVAIPISFFKPVQAATLMDLNTRSIGSGTNVGQIRLNVASVVTNGAGSISGLNVVVTSNNLGNPSDILRIKRVYARI